MKYPTLVLLICIDIKTNKEYMAPAVLDLDIDNIRRFYKSGDGFVWVAFKDEGGYFKVGISFWEFLEKIKDKNNIDMSLEDLIKQYDKDSPDDIFLNGV